MADEEHLRRNAQQHCDALRERLKAGELEAAKRSKQRAVRLYIEAGLDPKWFNLDGEGFEVLPEPSGLPSKVGANGKVIFLNPQASQQSFTCDESLLTEVPR
jgi:hypothetical protein